MNKKIIIAKDNEIAYNYLVDNFAGSGIKFKIKKSNYFIIIQVDLDNSLNDIFVKYMAKAIILSHKYKEIMSAFEELPMSYANIACISALLYFDLAGEIEQVSKIIGEKDTISVEGTFTFKFGEMLEDWEELKNIGQVLTYSDQEEDIYNVATFMMSTRGSNKSLFLAQYPDILLANVTDGLMVESIKLYKNDDFNLINAVISECPTELIIEKNQLKKELFDCLNKLVKVKEL